MIWEVIKLAYLNLKVEMMIRQKYVGIKYLKLFILFKNNVLQLFLKLTNNSLGWFQMLYKYQLIKY